MSDNLTSALVSILSPSHTVDTGIPLVVKYVPYATLDQALPYLIRRLVFSLISTRFFYVLTTFIITGRTRIKLFLNLILALAVEERLESDEQLAASLEVGWDSFSEHV